MGRNCPGKEKGFHSSGPGASETRSLGNPEFFPGCGPCHRFDCGCGSGTVAPARSVVATDLAARGIDIVALPAVVSYDLPRSPVDYVHRIGRTGRAGEPGVAVTFVTADAEAHFRLIEKRHHLELERERVVGFEPSDVPPSTPVRDPNGGVKGKRPNKKDKAREAKAEAAKRE